MIIDSEDEQPPPPPPPPPQTSCKPVFDEEEEELNPLEPYAPIIQHLDLVLNTEVLHLAFPPIPTGSNPPLPDSLPPIATQRIVMAVACADNSVRIITLPLIPPSATTKGREELRRDVFLAHAGHGKWGEKMLVIAGSFGHQAIPSGIAITFSPKNPTPFNNQGEIQGHDSKLDGQQDDTQLSSRPGSQPFHKTQEWDVLLASHSDEGSGAIFVFRIPTFSNNPGSDDYNISTSHQMPLQTLYLSSPAVTMSFNPSQYPSARHTQLLIVDSKGAVRIYDCCSALPKSGGSATGRHSSGYRTSSTDEGSWLGSFYPGFANRDFRSGEMFVASTKSSGIFVSRNTSRKSIIDAQWINGGRGIISLTADGEWGVWDIEGMGPGSRRSDILGGEIGRQRVQGGANTRWSLSSRIDKSSTNPGRRSEDLASSDGKPSYLNFAPMTPSTRKTRQETLFSSSSKLGDISGYNRGGISVSSSSAPGSSKLGGDLVVIWFEDTVIKIPNLWAYWEAQLKNGSAGNSGNPFNLGPKASTEARFMKLETVDLRREKCCGVNHFPTVPAKRHLPPKAIGHHVEVNKIAKSPFSDFRGEILVTGEHRLIILSGIEPTADAETNVSISNHVDEQLSAPKELDVNGIDNVLERMENVDQKRGLVGKRKVGFLSPS
ncbi:hypothetical protein GP486_001078 [Trichoglossum hirsutum]|uniref:Uncharacterized protein n=1 Tax=Trichoglossum hirsutum TaxID=265104 RepID=A0A9P8LHT9_9PEZI|nr:hypothetical protein GP486_001078 [Trichoglossum hirsutum]